jgi:hypothetical protein
MVKPWSVEHGLGIFFLWAELHEDARWRGWAEHGVDDGVHGLSTWLGFAASTGQISDGGMD